MDLCGYWTLSPVYLTDGLGDEELGTVGEDLTEWARFTAENSEFRENDSLACEKGVCFAASSC